MIKIGEQAPSFTCDAYYKNEFSKVSFDDYKGKWVILFFYPADFTFVCPTELGELADYYDQFQKEGAEILSVSTDTHFTHLAWHDSSETIKKIKFPMLADPTGNVSRDYGVMIEAAGLALRGTFIIDPDGKLVSCEINDPSIGRSSDELLRKLQAAKFVREHGEVCPASWKPGEKTLKPGLDLVGKI
ncbi:MAG: redoxin domain-containing protein [candidate division Zixibacteria bacterium]|nr:redoxin domain-containing protein [candidate division Zixibacteria bacterium]